MNPSEPHEFTPQATASNLIDDHLRHLAPLVASRLQEVLLQREQIEVSTKSAAYDLVTDADRSIEAWLWEETHRAFPNDGFLGEEHGWQIGPTGATDWVIDPIDGTVNFVSGLPWACCSVGALVAGAAEGGLIVDPFRADTYLTASSLGRSELNGAAVEVAPGGDLAGRVVLLEVPSGTMPSALSPVEEFVQHRDGAVRFMGSGALALAMVASGRTLAVVHLQPSIWDIAAGVALVEHAGGIVLGGDGPYVPGQPGPLVAGNPAICERLQPLLGRCGEA
jgi:myo-inositol-1(or 4)-monophosphatase